MSVCMGICTRPQHMSTTRLEREMPLCMMSAKSHLTVQVFAVLGSRLCVRTKSMEFDCFLLLNSRRCMDMDDYRESECVRTYLHEYSSVMPHGHQDVRSRAAGCNKLVKNSTPFEWSCQTHDAHVRPRVIGVANTYLNKCPCISSDGPE
jgi:hypothetical protein